MSPNFVKLLLRLAVALPLYVLGVWIAWKLGGVPWMLLGVMFFCVPVAFAISRPLIEVVHEGGGWIANAPLEQWEGKYYEFAGVQIRIYEYEGELWFAVADIAKSTGLRINVDAQRAVYQAGCRVLPGTAGAVCMTAPTVEKFIAKHPGQETGRFLLWMQREVMMPWERKKVGQLAHR